MNDPKVEEALRRLAERGTPRGADRVLEDANRADVVVRPLDGPSAPAPDGRLGARLRYAVAAAVIAAVAVGGLAYALRDDDTTTLAAGPSNFCDVMVASVWNPGTTAFVYVDPEAGAEVVADVGEVLDRRPEVRSIRYVDTAETYQDFTELFDDDAAMLENVRPEDLPTSFEVELVDQRAATRTSFRDAVVRTSGVYEVSPGRSDLRVVDFIAIFVGVDDGDMRTPMAEGVLLQLDDLDEGSLPAAVLGDLDTVAESLADGRVALSADGLVDARLAKDRVVDYVATTCSITAVDPQELREAAALAAEENQGD